MSDEASLQESPQVRVLGHYGALLSLVELGLGTTLQAFRIPFGGLFLSLNQGYLLTCASIKTGDPRIAYSISNVAAVMKSLAPAGNKLGPMLSLSMQGLLFSLGTRIGVNLPGLVLGSVLLSLWSFVQPVITYYLFFGDTLFEAVRILYQKTLPFHALREEDLLGSLLGLMGLKALTAIGLTFLAWRRKGDESLQERLVIFAKANPVSNQHPAVLALRDLSRPLFLASLGLTAVFLFYSQHHRSSIIWHLLRPLAVGFVFFYFSRTLTLDRWLSRLHGGPWGDFAKGCEIALGRLRKVL